MSTCKAGLQPHLGSLLKPFKLVAGKSQQGPLPASGLHKGGGGEHGLSLHSCGLMAGSHLGLMAVCSFLVVQPGPKLTSCLCCAECHR